MAKTRRQRLILIFGAAFLLHAAQALACPMCAELLEHGKDAVQAWKFGKGISWSIALMLSIPYVLVGSFIFLIWRSRKRNKRTVPHSGGD